MATIARLNVLLALSNGSFMRDLGKVQREIESVGKRFTAIGSMLTKTVSLPLLGVGAATVKMAIDVAEAQNKFNVSFGKMAKQAEEWAERTSKALGVSKTGMKEQAATLHLMLVAMGLSAEKSFELSTRLTVLAGDLSSLNNIPVTEAFDKLKGAIAGEAEGMRQFGVVLDQNAIKAFAAKNGIAAIGTEMTTQQKVLATVGLIMQQTATAQGDLARTGREAAGQIRALSGRFRDVAVSIGQALLPTFQNVVLPMVQRVAAFVEDLVKKFEQLPDSTKAAILAFAAVAVAAGPVFLVVGQIIIGIAAIPAAITAVGAAWAAFSAGWLVAGAAIVAGIVAIIRNWEAVQSAVMRFVQAARPVLDELATFVVAQWQKVEDTARRTWPAVQEIIRTVVDTANRLWAEHGEKVIAVLRRVITFLETAVSGMVDTYTGAFEVLVNFLNGDVDKAVSAATATLVKLGDGIGRYIQAGTFVAIGALYTLSAKFYEVSLTGAQKLVDLGRAFLALPWVDPVTRAAGTAALDAIDNNFAGIGLAINQCETAARTWNEQASAIIAPLDAAFQAAKVVSGEVVDIEGKMQKAGQVIDIHWSTLADKTEAKWKGGFGRGIAEGMQAGVDEGKQKIDTLQAYAEANPIVWPVRLATPDGMDIEQGLMGRGGG